MTPNINFHHFEHNSAILKGADLYRRTFGLLFDILDFLQPFLILELGKVKIQQINSVLDVYSLQEGLRKWKVIRMLDFVSTGQKSTNFVVFFREKNQKHSKFSLSNLTLFDIVNSHFETSNLSRHLKIVGDSDPNFLITDLLVMLNELTIFIHCNPKMLSYTRCLKVWPGEPGVPQTSKPCEALSNLKVHATELHF